MATATMATAAGAAMVLYLVFTRRLLLGKEGDEERSGDRDIGNSGAHAGRRRVLRRPLQPPSTWREAVATLSETLRFTYSETLGKWPIADLAFGIKYLMRRQGDLQVASVYAGENCKQLQGPEIIVQMTHLLRLLTLCMFFSKKPFPIFLESTGFSEEDVLLQERKAGLLKPAFTIIRDKNSKCFLLLIRGTHSIKDTLTAVNGAVVPFHHSVIHEGGVSNLVLGYAHCGMVAAARWIAKCSIPCLLEAVAHFPDYEIKVVGHSLGGGTAALLTYILREHKEFSSTTCICFAPAACMTWDLAESGKQLITTVINGSDLVPTFSTASIDVLRSEVTSSSWLNDLRDQVEHTRILNVVYRSASALGARLPSISNAKARVAGAGSLLRPMSSSTQIVMKRAQTVAQAVVKTRSSLSSWSCMGARRRLVGPALSPADGVESYAVSKKNHDPVLVEDDSTATAHVPEICNSKSMASDEAEHKLIPGGHVLRVSVEEISEGDLWLEFEKELSGGAGAEIQNQEDAISSAQETLEEDAASKEVSQNNQSNDSEAQSLYPPGRIMHIVATSSSDDANSGVGESEEIIGMYDTPRELYSKIRLSRTMINDHYMPMYKKMMELLIDKLKKDVENCTEIL